MEHQNTNGFLVNKALIFLNGRRPTFFPETKDYSCVIAADGALEYLQDVPFRIDFCLGDMDSVNEQHLPNVKRVKIADQSTTDFEKILNFLLEKKIYQAHVYGASGREQDHFLGNLSAVLARKSQMKIRFYDNDFYYFLSGSKEIIQTQKGKIISLVPFPKCKLGVVKGLAFPASNLSLELGKVIGTRNKAAQEKVEINLTSGNLYVFVKH